MLEKYKTIYEGGEGEIVEKKSRFIATVRPVETEEEALAFIEEMKKKYWDARHNCYVYSVERTGKIPDAVMTVNRQEQPEDQCWMCFWGQDIYNVAAVVTRYFGGILLGNRRSCRAYSGAVQAGLAANTSLRKPMEFLWR